jgi:hypothetical protein
MGGALLLSSRQKQALAIVVLSGGAAGLRALRRTLKAALKEQQLLCSSAGLDSSSKRAGKQPKVAVDAVFAKRLRKIVRICVPGPFCYEAGLIAAQTALLVARTLLTDWSAQIEGGVGRYIIQRDGSRLRRLMALFCGVAVPAAVVSAPPPARRRRPHL